MINSRKAPSTDDLLGNFDSPSPQSPVKEKEIEKQKVPLSKIDSIVSGMKINQTMQIKNP